MIFKFVDMYHTVMCVLVMLVYYTRNRYSDTGTCRNNSLCQLQNQFFQVYIPATFADWLQGPYLYKLYAMYGFSSQEILYLYVAGFASSVLFGTCISSQADFVGRKKMCIFYNIINLFSCLTKLSNQYNILLMGRIFSGVATSILFSAFEAWYIHQHLEKRQLPLTWINHTLSKCTFYNGILAISAGVISNLFADVLGFGAVSPFVLAVPCHVISACMALRVWEETNVVKSNSCLQSYKHVMRMFSKTLFFLCMIQSTFECVMYIFIIVWTPVLSPLSPPLGIVFSCFMLCLMLGSNAYTWFTYHKYEPNYVLSLTMLLGSLAFSLCALGSFYFPHFSSYICLVAFLLYEVSVGLYFPLMGFIRSCVVPDQFRASINSWSRLPMNIITCSSLYYIRSVQQNELKRDHTLIVDANYIFTLCAFSLLCVTGLSSKLPLQALKRNIINNVNVY